MSPKTHSRRHVAGYLLIATTLMVMIIFGLDQSVAANDVSAETLLADFMTATDGNLITRTSAATNNLKQLHAIEGVLVRDNSALAAETRAVNFLQGYGAIFGIQNAVEETALFRVEQDDLGMQHVRLEQRYNGLPVFGSELIVHMDDEGIIGVNGNFIPKIAISTTPVLSAVEAQETALRNVIAMNPNATLHVADSSLQIYRHGLFKGITGENELAYAVEIRGESGDMVGEQIWISAETGIILDSISLIHTEKSREIYTPAYVAGLPVYDEQTAILPPPPGPIANLYDFAGGVYDLFFNAFGRDAWNDNGDIQQSVYLINQNCPNAYWDGNRTNYCPGFDLDDVVAHEWGHGYTQETHGLIYSYQSGALNESYSDIWGETYDIHNGADGIGGSNNDEPYPDGQRWVVGEDLTEIAVDLLLRDMWDPIRVNGGSGDPDRTTSPQYHCEASDSGGVHTNSGVPNHGYAMLVDGKTYNNQTVEGIGFVRAMHIYYRASTVYQIRSTDFPDHAQALRDSCTDLIGAPLNDFLTGEVSADVITLNHCKQVDNMIKAVELEVPPVCDFNFERILAQEPPALCSTEAGSAEPFYIEDWESGMDGWSLESGGTNPLSWPGYNWEVVSDLPLGVQGSSAFAINEVAGDCALDDISGSFAMTSPEITVPDTNTPLEMSFSHRVDTERDFDGGNLLISINGGAFALVPDGQYRYNAPNTTLSGLIDTNTNPKGGEIAWSGVDQGFPESAWGVTIVDLDGLGISANDTIQLKFDFGLDACNGVTGWHVDTITAASCSGAPTAIELSSAESAEPATATNWTLIVLFAIVGMLSAILLFWRQRA